MIAITRRRGHGHIQIGSAGSLSAALSFAIGVAHIFVVPRRHPAGVFSWIVFCAPMLGMLTGRLVYESLLTGHHHGAIR
jgi:hypothetical protein